MHICFKSYLITNYITYHYLKLVSLYHLSLILALISTVPLFPFNSFKLKFALFLTVMYILLLFFNWKLYGLMKVIVLGVLHLYTFIYSGLFSISVWGFSQVGPAQFLLIYWW